MPNVRRGVVLGNRRCNSQLDQRAHRLVMSVAPSGALVTSWYVASRTSLSYLMGFLSSQAEPLKNYE